MNTTSIQTTHFDTTPAQRDRSYRQTLLRWAQEAGLLGGGSVSQCLRHGLPSERPRIMLAETADGRRARWAGVCRCKSASRCVWCAPLEGAERAREINRLVHAHLGGPVADPNGRGLYLVSLGVPHYRGEKLEDVFAYLDESIKRLFTGRNASFARGGEFFEEFGVDVTGWLCAIEINYGQNGWHPHCHILLFTDKWIPETDLVNPERAGLLEDAIGTLREDLVILDDSASKKLWVALTGREVEVVTIDGLGEVDPGEAYKLYVDLENKIKDDWGSNGTEAERFALWVVARWRESAVKASRELQRQAGERTAYPSYEAQDVRTVQEAGQVADYLTKFGSLGFEVSGGARKAARAGATPFQLLACARHPGAVVIAGAELTQEEARELWREYFKQLEGRRLVRWSQGKQNLRKLYEDAPEVGFTIDLDGAEPEDALWTEVGEVPHWAFSVATGVSILTPDEEARADELRAAEWAETARAAQLLDAGAPGAETPKKAMRAARLEARPDDEGRALPPPPKGRRGDVALLDFAEADPDLTARWCAFLVSAEFHFQLSAPEPGNVVARERAVRKALRGLARGEDPWGGE